MKLSMKRILPIVLTASLVAACGGATAKQQTAPEKKAEAKPAATLPVHTDGSFTTFMQLFPKSPGIQADCSHLLTINMETFNIELGIFSN